MNNWFCHICQKPFDNEVVYFNTKYNYEFTHCPECQTKVCKKKDKFWWVKVLKDIWN
jgi:hypothetical protein